MNDFGAGFAIGIAVGLGLGLAAGRKRKPWSELTDKEKKVRIAIIAALGVAVIASVVVLLVSR